MLYKGNNVTKDGEGYISLVAENSEDMWHIYNIVSKGDEVRAPTIRKLKSESDTGSTKPIRIRCILTIIVENIEYDAAACMIRLNGKTSEEHLHVKMQSYHTLELDLKREFSMKKEPWDSISLERLNFACNPAEHADVAAVLMEEGTAQICLITPSITIDKAKIDYDIPRKRRGCAIQHDKRVEKFYELVMQAVLRHIDFDVVKCIMICSPGFVKDKFFEYMFETAFNSNNKILLDNKAKFLLVHSSSGFKHSLKEVMQDPTVIKNISDTKASGEVKALEDFYTMLQINPSKAFYGLKHIQKATEAKAVETLLISDKLFRCQDGDSRKLYVGITDDVKKAGGKVKIFSSLHITGERMWLLLLLGFSSQINAQNNLQQGPQYDYAGSPNYMSNEIF